MRTPLYFFVASALLFCGVFSLSAKTRASHLPQEPLTLEAALDYALQRSPSLEVVRQQLREQEGILVQSFSGLLPSVVADAQGQLVEHEDQLTGGAAGAGGRKAWSAEVLLRQTLFAGGAVVSSVRANYASFQAVKARVISAVESTVFSVKEAFYRILVAREIIVVHQEALQVLQEQLKNVEAKHAVGVASDFELLQAQVAVANERPVLIRAQNDYRVATEALQAILGTPPDYDLNADTVVGTLQTEALNPELGSLLESAKLHRADIRAANRDFAAAQSAVWTARAGYLPSVEAFGGYGWQKNVLTTNLNETTQGWLVGVSASWTLFDGFGREGRIHAAKARRRQAAARDLQTRLNVSVEVRQAYADFDEARQILESSSEVVGQARESLRMAKARYEAGSSTQLDVLQAQSAFSQAQLSYLQAQYDLIVAVARLEKATGDHSWKLNVKAVDEVACAAASAGSDAETGGPQESCR